MKLIRIKQIFGSCVHYGAYNDNWEVKLMFDGEKPISGHWGFQTNVLTFVKTVEYREQIYMKSVWH